MKKLLMILLTLVLLCAVSALAELGEADVVMEGETYHLTLTSIDIADGKLTVVLEGFGDTLRFGSNGPMIAGLPVAYYGEELANFTNVDINVGGPFTFTFERDELPDEIRMTSYDVGVAPVLIWQAEQSEADAGIPAELVGEWTGVGIPENGSAPINLMIAVNADGTGEYTFEQSGYVESYPFTLSSSDSSFSVNIPADNYLGITECGGSYDFDGEALSLDITTCFESGRTFGYTAVCTKKDASAAEARPAEGVEADFADEALLGYVREAVGLKEDEPLTEDALAGITELNIEDEDIPVRDLRGIEHLTNLKQLDFSFNEVSDLFPIAALSQLEELNVGYNKGIADLSPVSGLENLKSLRFPFCNVSDLSPLAGLNSLESLAMGGNPLTDVTPIADLPALKSVSLEKSDPVDTTPLLEFVLRGGTLMKFGEVKVVTPDEDSEEPAADDSTAASAEEMPAEEEPADEESAEEDEEEPQPSEGEIAVCAWLDAQAEAEQDPWIKGILTQRYLKKNIYPRETEDGLRMDFYMRMYVPEEDYAAYTGEDAQDFYYRTVYPATAAKEVTLDLVSDGDQYRVTEESGQALMDTIRSAASVARKAFDTKNMRMILADNMLNLAPDVDSCRAYAPVDRDLNGYDMGPLFHAQASQTLNVSGGPHALIMSCKGADAQALVDAAYDEAYAVLSRTEGANGMDEGLINNYLSDALWEQSQKMLDEGRMTEFTLTFDLDDIEEDADDITRFGADYKAYVYGYADAFEAALERLVTEVHALPDLTYEDFDYDSALEIVRAWMAEAAEKESDPWVKGILNVGPGEIDTISYEDEWIDETSGESLKKYAEFLMPKYIPDMEYFSMFEEEPEYECSLDELWSLVDDVFEENYETVYRVEAEPGDDFKYHITEDSGAQVLKQIRTAAANAKTVFDKKIVRRVFSESLFRSAWYDYELDSDNLYFGDLDALVRSNTDFSLSVSGGPEALVLKSSGPDAQAFAQEYYEAAKEHFSLIAYANSYSEGEIRDEMDRVAGELAEKYRSGKGKNSAARSWTISMSEMRGCLENGTVPGFLTEYYDAFVEAMEPLYRQLIDDIAAMPDLPDVPLPSTGRMTGSSSGRKVVFKTTDPDTNVYIVVKDYENWETVASLFIRGSGSATCYLKSGGTYCALVAEGDKWYGTEYLFGEDGIYSQTESFNAPGSNQYATITLTGVTNGNMSSYGAGISDFH